MEGCIVLRPINYTSYLATRACVTNCTAIDELGYTHTNMLACKTFYSPPPTRRHEHYSGRYILHSAHLLS